MAGSSVGDRVILREQDVSSLDETETYAFAWVPAPFLPASALVAGVRARQERSAGRWLADARAREVRRAAVNDAVGRFKTIAYGGTALNDKEAQEMLKSAGLVEVRTVPTPHGSPAITVGRKPPAA